MCALIARTARPVTLVATVIRKRKKMSVEEVKKNSEKEREARTEDNGPQQREEFVHFNHI